MLPTEYKEALQAMKAQAAVALKMLLGGDSPTDKDLHSELAQVHQRIARHSTPCRRITKLLLTTDDEALTIETLDEARLASELGFFDEAECMPWKRIDPPYFWEALGAYVIADRHLPDGTRQHMVRGEVPEGTVFRNAQIVSEQQELLAP